MKFYIAKCIADDLENDIKKGDIFLIDWDSEEKVNTGDELECENHHGMHWHCGTAYKIKEIKSDEDFWWVEQEEFGNSICIENLTAP